MSEKTLNQTICLKKYISEKDYKEINELKERCILEDKINLKLELDYKLNIAKKPEIGLNKINEFLYYVNDVLVSYIGISSFGNNMGELNGLTHPAWRRKGIFKKLFELAMDECGKRKFTKILLLTDNNSNSGIEFIKSINGSYDFSEFRMKQINNGFLDSINSIKLRKAKNQDSKEIQRQNTIFFNDEELIDIEYKEYSPEDEEILNEITYMIELKGEIIGKIKVDYSETSAFICGFGIVPEFRGKGYGKESLLETISLITKKGIHEIELDVEGKNSTALNLYKSCGFEERSTMNYYKYNIDNSIGIDFYMRNI